MPWQKNEGRMLTVKFSAKKFNVPSFLERGLTIPPKKLVMKEFLFLRKTCACLQRGKDQSRKKVQKRAGLPHQPYTRPSFHFDNLETSRIFLFPKKKKIIYLFLAASGLRCSMQDLSLLCAGFSSSVTVLTVPQYVESQFPDQGSKQGGFLTTGPPGKSQEHTDFFNWHNPRSL